jgi:hypothetical protein
MHTTPDGAKLAWRPAAPAAAAAIQIASATVCSGDGDRCTLITRVGPRRGNQAPGAIVGGAKSAINLLAGRWNGHQGALARA